MLEEVDTVRSFNRTVTQTIGALNDHYLGRDRPLGECRLIFEIGEAGAEVGELRARLDLNSGYASRLLRSLEQQGLVATEPGSPRQASQEGSADTGRSRRAGRAEPPIGPARSVDPRSRSTIMQQRRLVEAMAEVERLLTASAVRVEEVPPTSRDAQFCLAQYFKELGERFETGFDPAQSLAPTLEGFAPPRGTFLVMRLHGQPVGCGGFKPEDRRRRLRQANVDFAHRTRAGPRPAAAPRAGSESALAGLSDDAAGNGSIADRSTATLPKRRLSRSRSRSMTNSMRITGLKSRSSARRIAPARRSPQNLLRRSMARTARPPRSTRSNVPSSRLVTLTSDWTDWGAPSGMTIRPPGFSCSIQDLGT